MMKKTDRPFRRPVISRLALAWSAFMLCGAGLVTFSFIKGDPDANKIVAIEVHESVQTVAQPIRRTDLGDKPVLRGATSITNASLADASDAEASLQGATLRANILQDVYADVPTLVSIPEDEEDLLSPVEPLRDDTTYSNDVIITVDGEPARRPGERLASIDPVSPTPDLSPGTLVVRPISSLLTNTVHGKIPSIGKNGHRPSRAYAKPYSPEKDKPQIGIVVSGLGLNGPLTERAIDELPSAVTLAFAPYAKNLEFWVEKARKDGHEVVLELPMEAYHGSTQTLGPAALLTSRSREENLQRLDWMLSRFKGYFAATNYLGGKFSADPTSMKPILEKLKEAGIGYIDDTGAIRRAGVRGEWTTVNRVISSGGNREDANGVNRDLTALEKIAERDGDALGKTFAYDVAISEIKNWSAELSERGFQIVPASTILHDRGSTL